MNKIIKLSQIYPTKTVKEIATLVDDDEVNSLLSYFGQADISLSSILLVLDEVEPLSYITKELNPLLVSNDLGETRTGLALQYYYSIHATMDRTQQLKKTIGI